MLSPQNPEPIEPRKRRRGCLGCLWQVSLILLLGAGLVLAMTATFYPWAFYLGGRFHIIPYWQGWGKLHAQSGDYVLFVRMEPTSRGSGMYLQTNLTGIAYVCTPRGESLRLRLGGGMRKHLNLSTDGEAIGLYMLYWPWDGGLINDHNPSLQLRGHWRNPYLVMDDEGSIAKAFRPDGTVYRFDERNHTYTPEAVPVTFIPGSYSDYSAACAAMRR